MLYYTRLDYNILGFRAAAVVLAEDQDAFHAEAREAPPLGFQDEEF